MNGRLLMPFALAAAVTMAACGGGNGGTGSPSTTSAAPGVTTPAPTATSTATSGETRVAMEDNFFQPKSISVASGAEVQLDNEGQAPHTFTIDGQDIDEQVNAGEDAKVTLDLPAGSYDFYCRFHKSLGMTGTLTVS